jgi:hypothetical protein
MKSLRQHVNEALKIKSGTNVRYNNPEYFCHEALEDGYTTKFNNTKNVLQYSIDNCNTWNDLEPATETPEINAGERIYFKGENLHVKELDGIGAFFSYGKKFNVGGNVMSLIYGDDFYNKTELLDKHQFISLFLSNNSLISANDLILPAIKLTEKCYAFMFHYCTSLQEVPELPATKLSENCYEGMFSCCFSLTKAPKLPATELAQTCYGNMFGNCKSLVNAPELPATKLVEECYRFMFGNCLSLKKITMLATDISENDCLNEWVKGVANTGTFVKAKGVKITKCISGIPRGWVVQEI